MHDTHRPAVGVRFIGFPTSGCQSAAVGTGSVADIDTDPACKSRSTRAAAGAAGVFTITPSVRTNVHDTHRPAVGICLIGACTAGCQSAAVGASSVADVGIDPACRSRSTYAAAGAAGLETETPRVRAHVYDPH